MESTQTAVPPKPVEDDSRSRGVTPRVVVLCLVLALFFGYLLPTIDVRLQNTFLGATHLPAGGIGVLLALLLVVNPLLKVLSRRGDFGRNEVLTVYISCLFSCLVPGHGSENYFVTNILAPFYYATPENKWMDFLREHLSPLFTPALNADGTYNKALVEAWYVGNGGQVPWGAWLTPLLMWSLFIFASYAMLCCLAVMLRAQWAGNEALRFPLLELPLALAHEADGRAAKDTSGAQSATAPSLLRNRLMWGGFGLVAVVQIVNGLNLYFPDVPKIPLSLNTAPFFSEAPWNQLGWTPVYVIPFMIGVTYLLSTEIAFSLWAGVLFFKAQYVFASLLGFPAQSMADAVGNTGGAKAFAQYQQVGVLLTFVGLLFWTGRAHFGHIARRAFGREAARPEEAHEVFSYPIAFWGFVVCFALMLGWSTLMGIRPDIALALLLAYLFIVIALTRVIAEGGLLFVQPGWTPLGTMAQIMGSGQGAWLGSTSVVPAAIVQNSMMVNLRAFLLPSFLQSFKVARDEGIRPRPLLALIAAVIVISFSVGTIMTVQMGYQHGGLQLFRWFTSLGPTETTQATSTLLNGAPQASATNLLWLGVGALEAVGLMWARSRLMWFPFHPIGIIVALTYSMAVLWFSIFLGWLLKSLIMRFGGTETYRNATPFFLGLALGDVAMILFWLIVDGVTGRTGHQLMF